MRPTPAPIPRRAGLMALAAAVAAPLSLSAAEPAPGVNNSNWVKLDVPYVPTPYAVVKAMLDLAEVKPDDVLYDLGSGDGRIVITAVRDYGVRKGVGIDLNPVRIREAVANAEAGRFTDRATFIQGDIFAEDFSEATVVTMYLLPNVNVRLRPTLLKMKPGTRIVSHAFHMFDWETDAFTTINGQNIYAWIIPAKAAGDWRWRVGDDEFRLHLEQKYQMVGGTLSAFGAEAPISYGRLKGETLTFDARLKRGDTEVPVSFSGQVAGGAIVATVTVDGAAASVSAVPVR